MRDAQQYFCSVVEPKDLTVMVMWMLWLMSSTWTFFKYLDLYLSTVFPYFDVDLCLGFYI